MPLHISLGRNIVGLVTGARCQSAFKCIVMDQSTLMLTSLISL